MPIQRILEMVEMVYNHLLVVPTLIMLVVELVALVMAGTWAPLVVLAVGVPQTPLVVKVHLAQ
jgi:hypothetical protein